MYLADFFVVWLDKMTKGSKAFIVQDYVEANVKNGVQFEGSTLLSAVAGGASNNTVFVTDSLPVILKGRKIAYSGEGVSAFIYEAPTYGGGSEVEYQNANAINPVVGLSKIIVGSTVTDDGDLIFAPVHSLGNQSRQGKGAVVSSIESEHVLKPNTAYLLRLTSLDSQTQDIASHLSWFEGIPDMPV